jgi:tetratricopeptide (TPR) repeat protein
MKWMNLFVKYRLWLGLVLLALAIFTNIQAGFWPSFVLYLLSVICILGHFLIGQMSLVQKCMEDGDMEGAKKIVDSIRFPGLLIKPVRSGYYTLKGHLDMANQNYESAEKNLKKSQDLMSGGGLLGDQMKQAEGTNKLQLGVLSLQKNDFKQAESYIRAAIRSGLPDKENEATAYLHLSSIMFRKREFRAGKEYFRKAKKLRPATPQILEQIKQMEKYVNSVPG